MSMLVRAGNLIDGTGACAREDMGILIANGRIAEIFPWGQSVRGAGEVVDARHATVLPGLIDVHVHPCMNPEPSAGAVQEPMGMQAVRGVHNMRAMLMGGITSIRTLGTAYELDFNLRRAIDQGQIPGPRMVAAGRGISMTGGHGHSFSIEADGPDQVRKAVRACIRNGADVIKLFATGGVLTPCGIPGIPQLDLDELEAAVMEAHKHGIRLAAHAEGKRGVNDALTAGIDSIEHGYFMDNDEGIEQLVRKGAWLVPTIMAYDLIANGSTEGISSEAIDNAASALEYNTVGFRNAVDAGAKIAMGSDAGTPLNDHGRAWRELIFMVKNGMRPMQALVAATKGGAELLGMSQDVGTLEPGKSADLIVVTGDPLSDISDMGRVSWVIKNGTVCKSEGDSSLFPPTV